MYYSVQNVFALGINKDNINQFKTIKIKLGKNILIYFKKK